MADNPFANAFLAEGALPPSPRPLTRFGRQRNGSLLHRASVRYESHEDRERVLEEKSHLSPYLCRTGAAAVNSLPLTASAAALSV